MHVTYNLHLLLVDDGVPIYESDHVPTPEHSTVQYSTVYKASLPPL